MNQALREAAKAELQKAGQTLTALPKAHSVGLQESARLEPGATLELKLPAGPGAIREFTVKLPAAAVHPEILRSTVVAMTHDGEETVWCPLGDFFCSADALHPIHTWQRTVADDGTMVCRWVMPYRASAAVRLLNLGAVPAEVAVQVVTSSWAWDERSMHFHANWRPDDVVHGTPFQDWNFIDIRGQGVLVGDAWTVLNVQGSWWGEGDEKIYVDDAWDRGFPTHFGTGTEDYYGWAGGEVPTRRDEFSLPFLPNARVGGLDGRTTGYNICSRTRSLDAIPFHRRLVFDMESSFGTDIRNPWNLLGYSAVTFWYAKPGASHNRPPRPTAAARPILTLAELKAKADAIERALRPSDGEVALIFTGSREAPIRRGDWPSTGSLASRPVTEPAFVGQARPGEFFVFQLGVYALRDTGPLLVKFPDLLGEIGSIPASAFRCLSLGGTNHLGRPFAKEITVKQGQFQPLWDTNRAER